MVCQAMVQDLTSKRQKARQDKMTQPRGKVFEMELSQGNRPSINPNWQKIGKGQRAAGKRIEDYLIAQRKRQRGGR